jgi:uncharacterized protein YdeI (YjbR/CyaY-like superfamily)
MNLSSYHEQMVANSDKPLLTFARAAEWHDWLTENFDSVDGVRLQLLRTGSALTGLLYAEALDEALGFGWIDGQSRALNADYYLDVFGPRRSRSVWSQANRDHVERLIAEGRMQPSGLAEVERAKTDGRWDAAYRQKDAPIPPDLQAALAASPAAEASFARLSGQNRFAILFRVGNVRRAETRAAKIAGYVAMLERGETIHPQKDGVL